MLDIIYTNSNTRPEMWFSLRSFVTTYTHVNRPLFQQTSQQHDTIRFHPIWSFQAPFIYHNLRKFQLVQATSSNMAQWNIKIPHNFTFIEFLIVANTNPFTTDVPVLSIMIQYNEYHAHIHLRPCIQMWLSRTNHVSLQSFIVLMSATGRCSFVICCTTLHSPMCLVLFVQRLPWKVLTEISQMFNIW